MLVHKYCEIHYVFIWMGWSHPSRLLGILVIDALAFTRVRTIARLCMHMHLHAVKLHSK